MIILIALVLSTIISVIFVLWLNGNPYVLKALRFIAKDYRDTRKGFFWKTLFLGFMASSIAIDVLGYPHLYNLAIWKAMYVAVCFILYAEQDRTAYWRKAAFEAMEGWEQSNKVLGKIADAVKEIEEAEKQKKVDLPKKKSAKKNGERL